MKKMICKTCQLKCPNKGKSERRELKPVPKWCPYPEVKYPDDRIGGNSVRDYSQFLGK